MQLVPEIAVTMVTVVVAGAVLVFHYEVIHLLNRWRPDKMRQSPERWHQRPLILITMFVLLLAHVVEVWLFGTVFWLLLLQDGYGSIDGYSAVGLLDCVYFSVANYTTAGWGDLTATGAIRLLAGTEALVGFMMITWSASFSYLVMLRTWGDGD